MPTTFTSYFTPRAAPPAGGGTRWLLVLQAAYCCAGLLYNAASAWRVRNGRPARRDSAKDFSRLNALCFTAMGWILIPAYCFAVP